MGLWGFKNAEFYNDYKFVGLNFLQIQMHMLKKRNIPQHLAKNKLIR